MRNKSLSRVQIKDADQGIVTGVFCTFDVIDLDGDVHRKGCFTDGAAVVISAYGHGSWDGLLPVGKGTIHEVGNEAVFEAKFFLNTTPGHDTFETVKGLGDLQEWSYSLQDVESERGTFQGKSVRFINKVKKVKEVSPTLVGAGINTRTLETKSVKQLANTVARMLYEAGSARWGRDEYGYVYVDDFDIDASTAVFCITDYSLTPRETYRIQVDFTRSDTSVTLGDVETEVEYTTVYLPKSSKFSEHSDIALRGVKSLVEMAKERLTLRAAEGKSITEQTAAYEALVAEAGVLKQAIDAATQPPADTADDDLAVELVRYAALTNGVPS